MSRRAVSAIFATMLGWTAPPAAFADDWRFVGFDEAGSYAFFDRTSPGSDGCRESSRVVFRTSDGGIEVSVPTERIADDPARCFPERGAIPAERTAKIVEKVASLYGAPVAGVPLEIEGLAFAGPGLRVDVEVRVRLPQEDCSLVDEGMRGRAYFRFRTLEGDRVRESGRLVEFGPRLSGGSPAAQDCWPDLALESGARSRDGKRLALQIGGIPIVLTRP